MFKKSVLAIVVALPLTLSLVHAGGKSPESMLKRLDAKLELSEEQEAKVLTILKANQPEDGVKLSREERRERRHLAKAQIAEILDEEQKSKFEKMRHHSPEKMVEKLDKKLNLSKAQETEILAILKARSETRFHELSKDEKMAVKQETAKKIEATLNPEQQEKFSKMKNRMMHGKKGKSAERMVKRLDKKLELSDQQETQILSLIEDKQAKGDVGHGRKARRAFFESIRPDIEALLTPDQKKIFSKIGTHKKG